MGQNPGKSQPEGEISRFCDIPGLGMGPKKRRGWVSGERMAGEGAGKERGGGYRKLRERWCGIVCMSAARSRRRSGCPRLGGVTPGPFLTRPALPRLAAVLACVGTTRAPEHSRRETRNA